MKEITIMGYVQTDRDLNLNEDTIVDYWEIINIPIPPPPPPPPKSEFDSVPMEVREKLKL